MKEKIKNYSELSDFEWIMELGFLVDMLCYLSRLNLNLQGKLKLLPDRVQNVSAFVNKLKLFEEHHEKGNLTHFPTVLKASGQGAITTLNKQRATYATLLETLKESFVSRFRDLQMKKPQIAFLVDPFNFESVCLKALLVSDEATSQLEMIDLCEKDKLKPALTEGATEFWKSMPMEKYPNIKRAALKVLSMFGSTYVCESVLSILNQVKSRHRPVLTDTHVKELLRVATTEYKPDLKKIVKEKECQNFHQVTCMIIIACKFLSLTCWCVTFTINLAEQRYVLMCVSRRWGDVHAIIISCV